MQVDPGSKDRGEKVPSGQRRTEQTRREKKAVNPASKMLTESKDGIFDGKYWKGEL